MPSKTKEYRFYFNRLFHKEVVPNLRIKATSKQEALEKYAKRNGKTFTGSASSGFKYGHVTLYAEEV